MYIIYLSASLKPNTQEELVLLYAYFSYHYRVIAQAHVILPVCIYYLTFFFFIVHIGVCIPDYIHAYNEHLFTHDHITFENIDNYFVLLVH